MPQPGPMSVRRGTGPRTSCRILELHGQGVRRLGASMPRGSQRARSAAAPPATVVKRGRFPPRRWTRSIQAKATVSPSARARSGCWLAVSEPSGVHGCARRHSRRGRPPEGSTGCSDNATLCPAAMESITADPAVRRGNPDIGSVGSVLLTPAGQLDTECTGYDDGIVQQHL